MMENTKKSQMVTVSSSSKTVENVSQKTSNDSNADVIMALNILDGIYKSNINAYAESIHACTRQIEDAKSRLESLEKEIAPETLKLQEIQKEIDYELRTLERFTQEWNEISSVITALEEELSGLNHSETERETILERREQSLKKLHKEIEDTELKLLEQELEKQNISLHIRPTISEISALTLRIKQLENEKHYIESSHLHKIAPLSTPNSRAHKETDSTIIDV